ncbi:MAG: helix-hairpin-helix domain-containing protein [Marinagarivorans sp.]|nr:helix-hairpin-helix domain-containing protein [Marinagarivorans sp.]
MVEKPVDRVVEKVVEKIVPDLQALALRDAEIARLKQGAAVDMAAAKRVGFDLKNADDIEIIEGIGPRIAELFHNKGIRTFAQIASMSPAEIQPILDGGGPNFRIANPETWPEQAALAANNHWAALRSLQDVLVAGVRVDANEQKRAQEEVVLGMNQRIRLLESQLAERDQEIKGLKKGPPIDLVAARAAGFSLKGEDDLEIVEGIGPKIADICRRNGIRTFSQLANTAPARLRELLDAAGPSFKIADPGTWPEQADLAARNRWADLKALQDSLDGGRRKA